MGIGVEEFDNGSVLFLLQRAPLSVDFSCLRAASTGSVKD